MNLYMCNIIENPSFNSDITIKYLYDKNERCKYNFKYIQIQYLKYYHRYNRTDIQCIYVSYADLGYMQMWCVFRCKIISETFFYLNQNKVQIFMNMHEFFKSAEALMCNMHTLHMTDRETLSWLEQFGFDSHSSHNQEPPMQPLQNYNQFTQDEFLKFCFSLP
ncbi:Hypothetical_protein [Hexamita inflata]|uniref:Hypothetical_protein n=1 Tax=Hexamita inflata TaxID=28002 RepID=A0AA86Q6M6_9EUKA|nr:Hypothetical protein HINF_LOCUS41029 [Hexamita inflata]